MSESSTVVPPSPAQSEIKLTDVVILNENMALNVIVSFLNVAQKRGAFNLDESAKIWECIQKFVNSPIGQSGQTA
jgi:hypothetical protein